MINALAAQLLLNFPPLCEAADGKLIEAIPQVAAQLRRYRAAWVQHPQFAHLKMLSADLTWLRFDDECWAEVLMVFRHKPGVDGSPYSFVVTDMRELAWTYAWATRTRIGDFAGIYALPEEFDCNPYRPVLYAFTHEGRAKGYHARMELKRLLPPKLRPQVSKNRRAARMPKYEYLTRPMRCNNGKPFLFHNDPRIGAGTYKDLKAFTNQYRADLPTWYIKTKAELWVEWLYCDNPKLYVQLNHWIDPLDFYKAVTGQIEPNDVKKLFKQPTQLRLL